MITISKRLVVALILVFACGFGVARADTIPPGTLNISFQNGAGTATGFFIYDPATNKITSWNFQLSAAGGFAASTYNSADVANNAAGAIALPNTDGDQVFSFEENQPNQPGDQRDEFDLVLACNGVTNCIANATVGTTFAITTGFPSCVNALKCIPAAEQTNVPSFGQTRLLGAGFFTVTDPNGLLAFNLDPTGTGGGGTNPVSEPSTALLLGSGIGLLFVLKSRSA